MSGEPATEAVSAEQTTVEELRRRVDRLAEGLRTAHDAIDELQEQVGDLEEENERLRSGLADVDERTDLQRHVADAAALAVEERAGVLTQTLHNEAQKKRRQGQEPVAAGDYNWADGALGGSLDRRQLLDAMDRADAIVDGPVLRFKKEPRSSQKNSRLVLDLGRGDLPTRVGGVRIDGGRSDG